ncbi:UNVERIFIED_CONTAM: hypothetical protein FKN15_017353 [Acipenser sinensis]
MQEPHKAPLLDAPITTGYTFGPTVEEMLQHSAKAREASQQMARMWPNKPFQPKRPQEHQWHRTPPQQQSEQDENAIQMAGDDVDIPEELRKMVDEDTVEEEEKDSILGQIQNIQNMDMDTIKEKAQATFSEMKEAAEQKCTVM